MLLKEARFTAQTIVILPGLSTAEEICSWRSFGRSQLLYLLELIISWKLYFCYQVHLSNPDLLSEGREEVIFPEKLSFLWPFNSIPKWRFNVFWMENRICVPFWAREKQKHKQHSAFSPWIHFCRAAGLWQQSSLHKANHFHKLQEGWWGSFSFFFFFFLEAEITQRVYSGRYSL